MIRSISNRSASFKNKNAAGTIHGSFLFSFLFNIDSPKIENSKLFFSSIQTIRNSHENSNNSRVIANLVGGIVALFALYTLDGQNAALRLVPHKYAKFNIEELKSAYKNAFIKKERKYNIYVQRIAKIRCLLTNCII